MGHSCDSRLCGCQDPALGEHHMGQGYPGILPSEWRFGCIWWRGWVQTQSYSWLCALRTRLCSVGGATGLLHLPPPLLSTAHPIP